MGLPESPSRKERAALVNRSTMVSEEPTVAETSECEDTGLLGDDVEPP